MEVSVISTENIKPWSLAGSDRHELKPFKLCLLDQLMVSIHSPLVLFYTMKDEHHDKKSVGKRLKASLSNTLNPFYPLAGRVKDNLIIHDFEKGVPFTETRVKGHCLSDVASPRGGGGPRLEFLNNLLPFEPHCYQEDEAASPQLSVQLNTFDCGGIAIGINLYHKLMDGATTSAFLHSWAANCSGDNPRMKKQPELRKARSVFPPRDSIPTEVQTFSNRLFFGDVGRRPRRLPASRRFVFDEKAIAMLRTKAGLSITNPTRLEALSAFIWESTLKAADEVEQQQPTCLTQGVNMRPLMSQRLSKHSVGNLVTTVMASCADSPAKSMRELVSLIRDGNLRVDENYVNAISGEQGLAVMMQGQMVFEGIMSGGKIMVCSSWIGFGSNNFDFGWGKPIWTGLSGDPSGNLPCLNNSVIFKEVAPRGRGSSKAVEAWIRLDEDAMYRLEHDPLFLQYASPNPPIILN
ncbi:unnamed protein product [Linum tenue]|uniref:Uncharacterized protein n=1 Tax=Linum tenue TaxID=586396 RepID=A0AAV0NAV0_9ROSI|nr:unnamed protein product [Linum tenue]